MEMMEILRLYLRSPLNTVLAGLFAGAALLSILFMGAPAVPTVGVSAAGYLVASLFALRSKRGARSIVGEKDRNLLSGTAEKIDAAAAVRSRIENLRLPDNEVRNSVRKLSYVAGLYVDACRKHATYSPVANEKLDDALSVLSDYLKELDEQAAEKHFGVADDTPFPDLESRAAEALEEDIRAVREKTREIEGGLDMGDRMDIREDLK